METARRARKAETPKQTSCHLTLRAPHFYPDHFVQTAAWRNGVRRRRAEPVARGWRAFCAYPGNRAQPKTVFAPQRGAETSVSCNLLVVSNVFNAFKETSVCLPVGSSHPAGVRKTTLK